MRDETLIWCGFEAGKEERVAILHSDAALRRPGIGVFATVMRFRRTPDASQHK